MVRHRFIRLLQITIILCAALINAVIVLPLFAQDQPNSDPICKLTAKKSCLYADSIPANGYKPITGDQGVNIEKYGKPKKALNAPDVIQNGSNVYLNMVSLGNSTKEIEKPEEVTNIRSQCEAYLIVQWTGLGIYDGPGFDFKIYEVGLNIGSGAAEPAFVYVSPDDETWYYIGKLQKNQVDQQFEGAFDLQDLALKEDTRIQYVGICDDGSDGETSSNFWGGPDIDAVAALNYGNKPAEPAVPGGQANGPGGSLNDQPLAEDQIVPLKEGDVITLPSGRGMDVSAICRNKKFVAGFSATVKLAEILEVELAPGEIKLAKAILDQCADTQKNAITAESWQFDLQEGGFDLLVPYGDTEMTINTPTASVTTVGKARYDVAYDSVGEVTYFWARDNAITIIPVNVAIPIFELPPGYQVSVTKDDIGQQRIISESYVPLVQR